MSQQISKSLYIFYEIVAFMEYKEKLKLQLVSKKFYENIIPHNIDSSSVQSADHYKRQQCLYHYACGYYFYRSLDSVITDLNNTADGSKKSGKRSHQLSQVSSGSHPQPHWQYMVPTNQTQVQELGLNKNLKFGRTLYIPCNKLIVISGENVEADDDEALAGPAKDVFICNIGTGIVEKKPDINVGRTSFAAHYDFGDRFIYVIGGNGKGGLTLKHSEKFDIYNEKWTKMPDLNVERANPGTFLSQDKRYLYVFQGFQNYFTSGTFGSRLSRALDTIERLDLWNESAGWQLHTQTPESPNIENMKMIKPKGCFTMFNMGEFDIQSIKKSIEAEKLKTIKQEQEEEKKAEDECDQIIETPGLKKVDQSVKFQKNAVKYNLKDKIIIFGGWQPYQNLEEIEVFDTKKNVFEDILPLAHNIRGRPNDAKRFYLQQKMISASTAHETDNGSENEEPANYEESDEDDVMDEENYMEQDDNRPSLETRFQQLNQMDSNTDSDTGSGEQLSNSTPASPNQLKLVKHSQDSSDEEMSDDSNLGQPLEDKNIDELRKQDFQQRKLINMQQGDKITKRPMQHGKHLIILARTHIHLFDLTNFTSHYLHNGGEDDAEKWALRLREMESRAKKADAMIVDEQQQ